MTRCHDGATYVYPHPSEPGRESWAVLCLDCERVLAVVDGPREEVFADL